MPDVADKHYELVVYSKYAVPQVVAFNNYYNARARLREIRDMGFVESDINGNTLELPKHTIMKVEIRLVKG